MLLSYTWLKSYLPKLPPPGKLVETLMLHGLDVESVDDQSERFDHVVVGQIVAIKRHPNADKLQLADVVTTLGGQPQEIVCGAPNIAVGQKVPVALIGAKLPNGITIEPRSIRGVMSQGMLCAEDELGLGTHHAGILVLDPKANIGAPLAEILGGGDVVFDVTTPTNRADLMSMRGLAWEIGAMLGQTPKFSTSPVTESPQAAAKTIAVQIGDPKLCSLFTVRSIRGLASQSTPAIIIERLTAAGMRAVNPIVDIANYIMLEYGQPLHAYDVKKISGVLTVRNAKAGERLTTLDGQKRTLTSDMLVVADQHGPVGIAGVMGGESSEVSAATTDIILEAAIFDPVSIRKTSRRLGLVSEASKRFEKGLWPEVTVAALNQAAAMMADLGGGTIDQGIVHAGKLTAPKLSLKFKPDYISKRLGMKIPVAKSKTALKHLGFGVTGTATSWTVTIPAWRPDVSLPEDMVDEVGRMVGYDHVPAAMPKGTSENQELPPAIRFREEVKNILVEMGFTEVISHAFYGQAKAKVVTDQHFEVANPLDETQHLLRKSLLPQMEDILRKQADAGQDALIFEIGLVFDPLRPGQVDRQQYWKLALGTTHKGEAMLQTRQNEFQKKLSTDISPDISTSGPVRGRQLEFCEFDLKELMTKANSTFGPWDPNKHVAQNVHYRELSKYPAVTRDISFWWPADAQKLSTMMTDFQKRNPLLRETITKDQFVKNGKTSYLISFTYQSNERTLTKAEVDKLEQKMKDGLMKLGATIR